ncbi:MAG: IS21-like element helper ATPase IstB [Actinomycetota bacterium]|nr:IS21-like element helper ATPase IstB [Actinomycetota bacterium]
MTDAAEIRKRLRGAFIALRLPTMRETFAAEAERAVRENLNHEHFLLHMVERECEERRERRVERLLFDSRLPLGKTLSAFDMKRLSVKARAQTSMLLTGEFVGRRDNVLAFGLPGTGKTHLLCGIARELALAGHKVQYWSCVALVQELLQAKREFRLNAKLKMLSRYDVLLLDDIGYVEQSREEMEVLFTLLAERYERGSVMITSNLSFSKWEKIFKDPMTTAAAVDRLIHHCVILELNVKSYRREEAEQKAG